MGCLDVVFKRCSRCRHWKSASHFNRNRSGLYGRHNMCRPCHVANNRKYRRSYRYGEHFQRLYGITEVDYQAISARQGGLCAICGRPDSERRLCVDHDHETGRVRGLLCKHCNMAIGQMGDSSESLRRAAEYLEGCR